MVALTNNWGASQLCCSAGQSGFLAFWGLSLGLGPCADEKRDKLPQLVGSWLPAGKTVLREKGSWGRWAGGRQVVRHL